MTGPYTRTLALSWEDINRDARELARRLSGLGPFSGIVAIARGGLVPAAIVARALKIRMVDTVCVASYRDRERGDVTVLKKIAGDGAGLVVVDDLADTGNTIRAIRALLPRAHYAVLYTKPLGVPFADTSVSSVSEDTWIAFPWDSSGD